MDHYSVIVTNAMGGYVETVDTMAISPDRACKSVERKCYPFKGYTYTIAGVRYGFTRSA